MPNNKRGKGNQPLTGKGKNERPSSGEDGKPDQRPKESPSARNRPEGDHGAIAEDERHPERRSGKPEVRSQNPE